MPQYYANSCSLFNFHASPLACSTCDWVGKRVFTMFVSKFSENSRWFIWGKLRNKREKNTNSNNQTQRINPLDRDFCLFFRLENQVYMGDFFLSKVEMFCDNGNGVEIRTVYEKSNVQQMLTSFDSLHFLILFLILTMNFMENIKSWKFFFFALQTSFNLNLWTSFAGIVYIISRWRK